MNYFQLVSELNRLFQEKNIPYHFVKSTSLWIQGVDVEPSNKVFVEVQWDVFDQVYLLFDKFHSSEISKAGMMAFFQTQYNECTIFVQCFYNTTIKTNPYRVLIVKEDQEFWCESIYQYIYYKEEQGYAESIHESLKKKQQNITMQNEVAWNQHNYLALLNRYGKPIELAEKVKQNPEWRLHPFYRYFDDLSGKNVIHLMGSNGVKGVSLALLGANVTIVDFSKENKAFATELADFAKVPLNYIVTDILSLPIEQHERLYDYVLMELGVLHYFIDLFPLMELISVLLKPNGKFILHEFHPISTKLITSSGKKHKVTGNYFDPTIEHRNVAFTKHMPDEVKESLGQVMQRKWTLGEVLTSVGRAGMMIETLEEEPNHKIHDIGLPKTFTLVARTIK